MLSDKEILDTYRSTIKKERDVLSAQLENVGEIHTDICKALYAAKGRIVVTGVGKSALIGKKIVATLNSTGSSSIFIHAADAVHGDLGMLEAEDIALCISKSGETSELKVLVPLIKGNGNKVIAITSNQNSYLARLSDIHLYVPVREEADPNDLAPTSSTTAHLAVGDALAMCLAMMKGFTSDHFAKIHPGGSLGKQLYLKVSDIYSADKRPAVDLDANLRQVLYEITSSRLGAAVVLDADGHVEGIITDGDIRRMLEKESWEGLTAKDIMSPDPKTVRIDALAVQALQIMRQSNITQLILLEDGVYRGLVHVHDILREGII